MRTLNFQKLYEKFNEQEPIGKFFEVEVEYIVEVSIRPLSVTVMLDGDTENFGENSISFDSVKTTFNGSKTFEVEAPSEADARKRFESLNTDMKKWDVSLYTGSEYASEGFDVEIEDVDLKVVSVRELES